MITTANPAQTLSATTHDVWAYPSRSDALPNGVARRARVTFSDHAWTRCQERHIPAGAAESVVSHAWRAYRQEDGSRVYIGRVARRFLKVVAEDRPFAPHIVTLYWVAAVD
jgi:hypothetical protein